MTVALALFVRPPVAGQVKTRLAAVVGPRGAADLYAAFLADTLATLENLRARGTPLAVSLWVAGDPDHPALLAVPGAAAVPREAQPEGDLGQRMARALSVAVDRAGAGLVLGSDLPTLPSRVLEAAVSAVASADLVLGPAADGGYYLVGARGAVPPVFDGIPWSTGRVLAETVARARRAGLGVHRLAPWYDVDAPRDLALLRTHLALDPARAPATARVLGLSAGPRGC